jgi:hypothetical protein
MAGISTAGSVPGWLALIVVILLINWLRQREEFRRGDLLEIWLLLFSVAGAIGLIFFVARWLFG